MDGSGRSCSRRGPILHPLPWKATQTKKYPLMVLCGVSWWHCRQRIRMRSHLRAQPRCRRITSRVVLDGHARWRRFNYPKGGHQPGCTPAIDSSTRHLVAQDLGRERRWDLHRSQGVRISLDRAIVSFARQGLLRIGAATRRNRSRITPLHGASRRHKRNPQAGTRVLMLTTNMDVCG